MNTANKITLSRFIITPLFFLAFYLLVFLGGGHLTLTGIILLWSLFLISEFSDILDGYVARKYNKVSDLGKLMDPFADVIFRVTYFVCFAAVNWIPWWAVMVILWREYTIMFIRMLLIKDGTVLAAKFWGKFKAVFYFLTGLNGMILLVLPRVGHTAVQWGRRSIEIFSFLSALFALISLLNYLYLFVVKNRELKNDSSVKR